MTPVGLVILPPMEAFLIDRGVSVGIKQPPPDDVCEEGMGMGALDC